MPNTDQKGADYQTDPKAPNNVHDQEAAGKGNKSDKQTPVPSGNPGDPTREPFKQINRDKVVTTKEEMPSPEQGK
jgi:hypothetical protein